MNKLIIILIPLLLMGCQNQTYSSDSTCNQDCQSKGYDQGDCRTPLLTDRNMTNLGGCVLDNSTKCSEDQYCQCYCYEIHFSDEYLR